VGTEFRCVNGRCAELVGIPSVGIAIHDGRTGAWFLNVTDQVASTKAILESSGRQVARNPVVPFGPNDAIVGDYSGLPLYFGAREVYQLSGLVLMGSRYYDPRTGRFTAADLGSAFSGEPLAHNRYAYAANNPVIGSDPNGDNPIVIGFVVGAAIGALSAGA